MEKALGGANPDFDRKHEGMNPQPKPVTNVVGKHADFQPNRAPEKPKTSPVVKK